LSKQTLGPGQRQIQEQRQQQGRTGRSACATKGKFKTPTLAEASRRYRGNRSKDARLQDEAASTKADSGHGSNVKSARRKGGGYIGNGNFKIPTLAATYSSRSPARCRRYKEERQSGVVLKQGLRLDQARSNRDKFVSGFEQVYAMV